MQGKKSKLRLVVPVCLAMASLAALAGPVAPREPARIGDMPWLLGRGGGSPPREPALAWHFELRTPTVLPGELVWGTVTVRNISDRPHVISPPARGDRVVTMEVWVSRPLNEPPVDGALAWSEPQLAGSLLNNAVEIATVDPIAEGSLAYGGQGKPLVLQPGERRMANIPLNVRRPQFGSATLPTFGWNVGVGTHEPGRYRFFLKYFNLEVRRPFPFADRPEVDLGDVPEHFLVMDLIGQFEVLGPFEVEVREPPAELRPLAQALGEVFRPHEEDLLNGLPERAGNYLALDVANVHHGNVRNAAPLLELPGLERDEYRQIRASLELAVLRAQIGYRRREDEDALRESIRRLAALREADLPQPLLEAIDMTRVWALLQAGQREQAMALAEQLGTADAIALRAHQQYLQRRLEEAAEAPPDE